SYFGQHIPADQYGFSKYIMTKRALASKNIYNLRLFATFGKYEDPLVRVTSSVCQRAAEDKPIIINQDKKYDFLYIDDLVRIVRWFIDNIPKHRVYNVCSGQTVSFKTIANKVIDVSGKKLDVIIKEPGLGLEYSGHNALLLKELKGFKFTPFNQAIKSLYEWYQNNEM
ncbi:MAG: NAD(P)-dependent oxidoreductase, partial [bacterium]